MKRELKNIIVSIYRLIKKRTLVFVGFVLFLSLLGIMESNGFSFVSVIRYALGNRDESNLYMIIAKALFVLVYASIGFSGILSLLETMINDNQTRGGAVLSTIKKNCFKIAAFYLPVSVLFEYLNYIAMNWSEPFAHIIASLLVLCKYITVFLFTILMTENQFNAGDILKNLKKLFVSGSSFIFHIIMVLLIVLVIAILCTFLIGGYSSEEATSPLFLWFPNYYTNSATLMYISRIFEAILTSIIFEFLSLKYFESSKLYKKDDIKQ